MRLLLTALLISLSQPAFAAPLQTIIKFTGTVTTMSGVSGGTSLSIGDQVSGKVTFDANGPVTDAPDPSTNVYFQEMDFDVAVGSYRWTGRTAPFGSGIVTRNDYRICPTCTPATDGVGFASMGFGLTNQPIPVELGEGEIYRSFNIGFFDHTASELMSPALSLIDVTALPSRLFILEFFNATTSTLAQISASGLEVSQVRVPEPSLSLFLTFLLVVLIFRSRHLRHIDTPMRSQT